MEHSLQQRVGWVDLLRIVACLMMVISHCCDPFVAQLDNNRAEFLTGALTGSMMRACVPLFTMLTGMLLLPVRMELGAFYRKRVGRILAALIFWSLVMPVLYYFYFQLVQTSSPCIAPEQFSWSATLPKLWSFVANFTYDTTPLWYLYMLVGLYLIMPILSAWLEKATKRELHILLGIWGFTLLMPYLRAAAPLIGYTGNGGNMGLFGVCEWNEFGMFHYVSGFAGYLLLAYYLTKYPPAWSLRKTLAICIPTFAVGYTITACGFLLMQHHFPGNYAKLEIVWYFSGINVALMTASLFMIGQKLTIRSSARLSRVAGTMFGVYLCHFIFVQEAYDLVGGITALPPLVRILLMAVITFGASYLSVRILLWIPYTRRFVQ